MSQDFHLAKRYYDQAAEVDSKARVPRDIALLLLEVRTTATASSTLCFNPAML